MFKITLLLFAAIFVSGGWSADVVDLTYVYETRCPFCVEFVNDQFYAGYRQVGSYVNLTLMPYAMINYNGDVLCQHGENECFISRAQLCAFRNVSQKRQVDFLYCTEVNLWDEAEDDIIDGDITEDDIKVCLTKVLPEVSWSDVQDCMNNGEADALLKAIHVQVINYGVEYLPALIFNGIHDLDLEGDARENFVSTICGLLSNEPEVCK